MKKLTYFLGPIVLGCLISLATLHFSKDIIPKADAISVPKTFSDGEVLFSADLNSNNNTVYNGFNAHDHDGGDGEPSTLSPSAIDTDLDFTSNSDIEFGDGASTSTGITATGITVKTNTGDARMSFKLNNLAANTWDILADNDASDLLSHNYNAVERLAVFSVGGLRTAGSESETSILINNNGSSSEDSALILRVNDTSANQWKIFNDNSSADSLFFSYNGVNAVDFQSANGHVNVVGGVSTFNLGDDHQIAWKRYSGTTCAYVGGVCTTVVDADTPGSAAPLSFHCTISDGTNSHTFGGNLEDAGGVKQCVFAFYEGGGNDLEISFDGTGSCTNGTYSEQAFKCIVFFEQ